MAQKGNRILTQVDGLRSMTADGTLLSKTPLLCYRLLVWAHSVMYNTLLVLACFFFITSARSCIWLPCRKLAKKHCTVVTLLSLVLVARQQRKKLKKQMEQRRASGESSQQGGTSKGGGDDSDFEFEEQDGEQAEGSDEEEEGSEGGDSDDSGSEDDMSD
jgi:uncharacterized membrane protein YgcG